MSRELLCEELWNTLEPLLPTPRKSRKGGPPAITNKIVIKGILFVLRSGIPWEMLPKELGCSGMTCWRRLRDWQKTGVWKKIHRVMLHELQKEGKLNWKKAAIDSSNVRALFGGPKRVPILQTRPKPGAKEVF